MNNQIRILFTSVGRRVELMQAYRKAADTIGVELLIYGADISDSAPALFFCDRKEIVCRISDPDYIPGLLEICKREKINALIPTIDTDLLLLSQNKDKFAEIGTIVLVSDEDKVAVCRDKRFTADYFIKCGLKSPVPVDDYTKYDGGYPAFIKPKDGSSSIDAYKVHDAEELKAYAGMVDDYIIQPFIEGREYTIDIFCDFNGEPVFITPRERVAVRSGEVLKTRIAQDDVMIEESKKLIADYKPCGAITVQLIKQNSTGDNYYIEINPRYGGGAPLSMKAGANSAIACLKLLSGENVGYKHKAAVNDAVYSRFDQCVCVSESNSLIEINSISEVDEHLDGIDTVIFDLDDTLYSEKDYVKSGYKLIDENIPEMNGTFDLLWNTFKSGDKTVIDTVLEEKGIYSDELKSKCLDVYRNQMPDISLYSDISELFAKIRKNGKKIGIITDGRPEGQRNKLKALGLYDMVDEIIITDEIGGAEFRKPCDISFRIMQRKLKTSFENMVYIGDNVKKDFIAPNELGMKSIYFRNTDGLYY